MLKNYCCSTNSNEKFIDFALLLLRLIAAGFMITHGFAKFSGFENMKDVFPDPLGIGNTASLVMIIIAELVCPILILFGLFTRLATIPTIIGMGVAAFVIHGGDAFQVRELSLLYMGLFLILLVSGAGKFSADYYISKYCPYCRKENK